MRIVARMTGMTADTIRVWERRYRAVEPSRTPGGTRRYSIADIRRLTLLREATQSGHTISAIAQLDDDALSRLVKSPPSEPNKRSSRSWGEEVVEMYLSAMTRFDTRESEQLIARAATLLGPRRFTFDVAIPIINEVNKRWSHAEIGVAQEHLVSAQIKTILSSLLRLSPVDRGARRIIVTTPPEHLHEFGVLIGSLIAASRGFDVVYLGPNLPLREILWAAEMSQAEVLLLGVVQPINSKELKQFATVLPKLNQHLEVWLGSPSDHALAKLPGVRGFHDYETLDIALLERASLRPGES